MQRIGNRYCSTLRQRVTRLPLLLMAVIMAATMTALVATAAPLGRGAKLVVAFYNVENLYDTIPSLFYDDSDYTPQGKNRWGGERYAQKLRNIAQVVDDIAADIIGLAEVESERAVRDLVMALKTDYNYIHRTSSDRRGIEQALLYKGDKFIPTTIRMIRTAATREHLYVRGELRGERVDIMVCHLPSSLNDYAYRGAALRALYNFADSLQRHDMDARLIIMGDFNANPSEKVMRKNFGAGQHTSDALKFMYNPLLEHYNRGFGSYVYNGQWHLYDNIFIGTPFIGSRNLRYHDCGIFIRDYLLQRDSPHSVSAPLRTFVKGRYSAGYSDHLPVYVTLELKTTSTQSVSTSNSN